MRHERKSEILVGFTQFGLLEPSLGHPAGLTGRGAPAEARLTLAAPSVPIARSAEYKSGPKPQALPRMPSQVISIATGREWLPRAHRRYRANDELGRLSSSRSASLGCLVEDISLGGARICPGERLCVGERFWLTVAEFALTVPARVVWTNDDYVGLAFCMADK